MKKIFFIVLVSIVFTAIAKADYSSTNYSVTGPVIHSGSYGTSTNFGLVGSISQMSIGQSASTNFGVNSGSLYFPTVNTPALAVTAGTEQATLTWSAAVGALGLNVSGYNVGRSTTSGGPYNYSNVGNVLSNTVTGLTGDTTYYFIIQVKDSLGNIIATSTEVSGTPSSSGSPGGGGGGGGGAEITAGVVFSGRAYPLSKVNILKDGQLALTTIAGPDSNFKATLSGLSTGNYTFALYGEDKNGVRSSLFTFPVFITKGVTTNIGGIFIAPTIAVDKEQVKKGDTISVFGQSTPNSNITININSEPEFFIQQKSDQSGAYLLNFDSSVLELGNHSARSKAILGNEISLFSNTAAFVVGSVNIFANQKAQISFLKGDLNKDGKVNLVDFSIGAFWYKKQLGNTIVPVEVERLNGDGKIDLVDFSIMAFNWTG